MTTIIALLLLNSNAISARIVLNLLKIDIFEEL